MSKKAQPQEPAALEADLGIIHLPHVQEGVTEHAGLLLFALIRPERRTPHRVALALGVTGTKTRTWCSRWCWRERCARVGRDADRQAAMLFRQLYVEDPIVGRTPLDRIAKIVRSEAWLLLGIGPPVLQVEAGVVADLEPDGDDDVEVSASNKANSNPGLEAIREKTRKQADAANEAHRKALAEKEAREEKARKAFERTVETFEKGRTLIEAYLGALGRDAAQRLQKGDSLELKPKDLPKLLEQYRELSEYLGVIQAPASAQGALEPSYRVQLAVATGGDVLQAMMDDLDEAKMIVAALQARRGVALETSVDDPAAGDGAAVEPPGAQEGPSAEGGEDVSAG
jgi:hypothetical protein